MFPLDMLRGGDRRNSFPATSITSPICFLLEDEQEEGKDAEREASNHQVKPDPLGNTWMVKK